MRASRSESMESWSIFASFASWTSLAMLWSSPLTSAPSTSAWRSASETRRKKWFLKNLRMLEKISILTRNWVIEINWTQNLRFLHFLVILMLRLMDCWIFGSIFEIKKKNWKKIDDNHRFINFLWVFWSRIKWLKFFRFMNFLFFNVWLHDFFFFLMWKFSCLFQILFSQYNDAIFQFPPIFIKLTNEKDHSFGS